jgi:hypothetical protein
VKSGTFKLRVDQKPIIPVSDGIKTAQNSPKVLNFEG